MDLVEPSKYTQHYPMHCMCDMEDDIEFDTPIVLKLAIYKPGTIKVKVNGDKKFSVGGGNGVFDVEIIADKEDAALHNMSVEDLKAMLASDPTDDEEE